MQKLYLTVKSLVPIAVLLIAACDSVPDVKAKSPAVTPLGLTVQDLVIREPVAGRDITVAYLTIRNQGNTERLLLGANSPYAKRIEIHEHQHNEGRMRMVKRSSLPLTANTDTVLQSGGTHLMLFELQSVNASGPVNTEADLAQNIELSLEFDKGETLSVTASLSSVLN